MRTAATDPRTVAGQDDRLPHQRRLAARARADRGGRGGQADGLPGRAQGPLRRAPQHRVVARARSRPASTSSTAFRRHEDPREGHADRAARGRRRCAVTRTSAPATTTRSRRGSTRTSASSPADEDDHGRPRRPVQLPDRLRAAARLPQAAGRAASRCGPAWSSTSARCAAAAEAGKAGADPDQGQPPRRRGDRRGALRRRPTWASTIEIFARTTCTLWPRARGGKEDIRVRSLLGRFFEHSRFFIFEADGEARSCSGSADLMQRNLDHRIEILVPVEDARSQRELTRTFDSIMDDTRWSWALRADGSWERGTWEEGTGAGQSLHSALDAASAAPGRGVRAPSPAPADYPADAAGDNRNRCESQSSTWARTRSACWWPSRTAGTVLRRARGARSSSASGRRSSGTATSARRSAREAVAGRARADAARPGSSAASGSRLLVTSPGRQSANSGEFADALARGTGVPVRILSSRGRGRAGLGRRAGRARRIRPRASAVCDVGGGSAQLVVGDAERGAGLGALSRPRLAAADAPGCSAGGDPPSRRRRSRRRGAAAAEAFAAVVPPVAQTRRWRPAAPRARCGAWSARSTRHGSEPRRSAELSQLEAGEDHQALQHSASSGRRRCSPGTILLAEAQRRLGLPLRRRRAAACARARRSRSSARPLTAYA